MPRTEHQVRDARGVFCALHNFGEVWGRKEVFFSEEKNQKTFATLSRSSQAAPTPEWAKVFCFFSSEKKTFSSLFHAGIGDRPL
jgi:hypothetical protein